MVDAVASAEQAWLAEAVELARRNVAAGGGPFGAVVVRAGEVVATGTNRVTAELDPTAHAEVTAIRGACRALGTFQLSGCVLVSSCEPCPMCLAAALWARLDRVLYAADRDDAAAAGFDDRAFYELFDDLDREHWPMQVRQLDVPERTSPFEAWRNNPNRVDY